MKAILLIQTIFFFITGIWPLIHINSFMKVTGPKTDLWLVKAVGVLVTAIAIGMLVSYCTEDWSMGVVLIAMLSALFLMGIDVYYAMRGIISRIYLYDAVVELVFVVNAFVFLMLSK
jgi:hypothetical protein